MRVSVQAPAVMTKGPGFVPTAVGFHLYRVPRPVPSEDGFSCPDVGASFEGAEHVVDDATLGEQKSPVGLQQAHEIRRQPMAGEPIGQFAGSSGPRGASRARGMNAVNR